MGWRTTGDVAGFLSAAGGYLRAERVRSTVILTVAEDLRQHPLRYGGADQAGRPRFGWWTGEDGVVAGAFLHTPPFPLVLSAVPATVAAELATRALVGRGLSGVNAEPDAAAAFAAAWRKRAGGLVEVRTRMRLYRLERLTWPDRPCEGASRLAREADAALLTRWFTAFEYEAHDGSRNDAAAAVRDRLGYGGIMIWEAGGEPVSLAGISRPVAGMARVGPVYTPPDLRGRGYASAVTAAVSRRALEAGTDEVLLYTDLANPVSNSIYQHIGYRPVEDRVELAFSAG